MDTNNFSFGNSYNNNSSAATQVNVVGMSEKALSGIVAALQKQHDLLVGLDDSIRRQGDATRQGIGDLTGQGKKQADSDAVRSIASERKQRAANAAVFGKIDKGLGVIGTLKQALLDSLSKLASIVGDGLKKSVASFQDFAKTLRAKNLTRAEKNMMQDYAKSIQSSLKETVGFKMTGGEINEYLTELIQSGKDLKVMSDEQRNIAVAYMKRGMSAEKAYSLALAGNAETLKQVKSLSDVQVADRAFATFDKFSEGQIKTMGGYAKVMQASIEASQQAAQARKWADANVAATLESLQLKIKAGTIGDKDLTEEEKTLTAFLNINRNDKTIDVFKTFYEAARSNSAEILSRQDMLSDQMKKAVNDAQSVGEEEAFIAIRSDAENAAADEQNTKEGRIATALDSFVRQSFIGDVLGPLATGIDEWFGDSLRIEDIASNGFKVVIGLLGALAAAEFIKSPAALLSKFGTWFAGLLGFAGGSSGLADVAESLSDAPDGPDNNKKGNKKGKARRARTRTPRARTGRGAGKGLKAIANAGKSLGKAGAKAIPVVGTVATIGLGAYEMYDLATEKFESQASESSSEAFKKAEEELNESTRKAKMVAAGVGMAAAAGGAALGASIGSAVPIVGTAIGAVIGAGVGAIAGTIADGVQSANETEIAIKNVEDLEKTIEELDAALTRSDLSLEDRAKLEAKKADAEKALDQASQAKIDTMIGHLASKNEGLDVNQNAIATWRAQYDDLQKELEFAEAKGLSSEAESIRQKMASTRQAMAGLAGGEFSIKEGESLDDALARIAADVRGDGWLDTREDVEYFAAESIDKLDKFLADQAIDKLTNGVFHDSMSDISKLGDTPKDINTIVEFLKQSNLTAGMSAEAQEKFIRDFVIKNKGDKAYQEWEKKAHQEDLDAANQPVPIDLKDSQFANGLVTDKATFGVFGEAGKEAILPLTRPGALANVLSQLDSKEKFSVLQALLGLNQSPSLNSMAEIVARIISPEAFGGSSGNTIADAAVAYARSQLGKPYSIYSDGFVCNTLVQAAFKAAGMKDFPSGTVSTHWKNSKLHKVPLSQALPGMIGFSNLSDKTGYPQHMGIITGDGSWINASGSSDSYSKGKFKASPKSKGVIESMMELTKKWKMVGAGYYDGMFNASTLSNISSSTGNASQPTPAESSTSVADTINNIAKAALDKSLASAEYQEAVRLLDQWQGGKLKPDEFIKLFGPIAREDMIRTGIPASITLAQAALESGWGKTARAGFRNLFGIKGTGNAGSVNVGTHEYYNGQRVQKRDNFAQYASYLDSVTAHSQYLLNSKRPKHGLPGDLRYAEALRHIFEPDIFARELKNGGYATSPTYAEKLISLIHGRNLDKWDVGPGDLALQGVGSMQASLMKEAANASGTAIQETKQTLADRISSMASSVVRKASGTLTVDEINSALADAGMVNSGALQQYVEQAVKLSGNKDDIIAVLLEIARYLKGMASAPANKPKATMSASVPYTPVYGMSI